MRHRIACTILLPCLVLLCGLRQAGAGNAAPPQSWLTTWATSPQQSLSDGDLALNGQTIRQRMRVTVGGHQLRVQLSNAFGKTPLVIGNATVGIPLDPASVASGSIKALTFSGKKSVTIPPGAPMLSDPVDIDLPADGEISVSLYLPQKLQSPLTMHSLALKTGIISPAGDFTASEHMPQAAKTESSLFITALLVPRTSTRQFTVVAFGDSITDGNDSPLDGERSWPADFARRLKAAGRADSVAIVNQGIGGNQLRRDFAGVSALARFDRDALSLPGVRYVVLLEGINDLGFPGARMGEMQLAPADSMPGADDLIQAYRQLIARAHVRGISIIGATVTPFEGTDLPGYYADFKEPVREAVNHWIRTSHAFDAVIDFDALLRDPVEPHRAQARLISPMDHLHPSVAGYQAMADAVDLALFR